MNNNLFEKVIVFPQVVLYKNALKDHKYIFNFFKQSELEEYQGVEFKKWQEWNSTNTTSGKVLKIKSFAEHNLYTSFEKEIVQSIKNVYLSVRDDYFSDWSNYENWPLYIKNWEWKKELDGPNTWHISEFNILKYSQNIGKKHDPKNGIYNLPMNYHVDQFPTEKSWPGGKFVITITMYLNDDYEGGEISFYDDINKKVYNYKPKAGDVTVFPSFEPFFHGVLPMSDEPRYLIRSFVIYDSEGLDEYFNIRKNYSDEEWEEYSKNLLNLNYENSIQNINILYDGDTVEYDKIKRTVILSEKPITIE